jgi:hypothetical protein
MEKEIALFSKGVHNLLDAEAIPTEAASDSNNWYTTDGRLKLINGKVIVGASGVAGSVTGEIFGYKADGSKVHFRKIGTKIQYLNGTTWTDVVTGLTSSADYSFANYASFAGTFTYATGIDGIYKIHTANPGSYTDMYNSSKNYKGRSIIDRGRMIMWDIPGAPTAVRGSYRDNETNFTPVSNEVLGTGDGVTTTFTGTLAFRAGNPKNTCYDIAIVAGAITGGDNNLGVFIGTAGAGVTGTINYTTGAYSITYTVAPAVAVQVLATYNHQNTNTGGITDFNFSAVRLAGEGFKLYQDDGGDPILNVLIGTGGYYSMKSQSTYLWSFDSTDLIFTNNVYRKEIGLPSWRACISTDKGIVFINYSRPEKPEFTILQKNTTGDAVEPFALFQHFKFANYNFDDACIDTYDRYVVVSCKTLNAAYNDTILLCDMVNQTVDITGYTARTFAKNAGNLYMGSSLTQSVYQLFNGYDDDTYAISNYWIGKRETWGSNDLKKYRKIRLKGRIQPEQSYGVYVDYDDKGFQLVGTVLGSGSYVDISSPQTIGSNMVGEAQVGGDNLVDIYPYFLEIRLKKMPKFRNRAIKYVALGIGYVDIDTHIDTGIDTYENKIPTRFRQKQNVNFAGTTVDNANPEF